MSELGEEKEMERLDLNNAYSNFTVDELESFSRSSLTVFDHDVELAKEILRNVLHFRRIPVDREACDEACSICQLSHLPRVLAAVKSKKPVTFVLPAFPGKSPNLAKVLGSLPDMAEYLALQFLQKLCDQIKAIYAPGAEIVLCSDGRVFSDVVGIEETDITNYQQELENIIR